MDIEVLGAGVLGLSASLCLAERGHDVRLIDPRGIAAGASGKGAGIVSTMTWNDDDFHLIQQTRGRIGMLMAEAFDVPAAQGAWRSHDSLTIAAGPGLATMDEVQSRLEHLGEEPERLAAREAEAAYPTLRMAPGEEVLIAQEDGVADPGDLCAVLEWACEEHDVELAFGPDAAPSGAEATVVAAGAWTEQVLAQRGATLPLAAFRTQAASIALATEPLIVHDTVHGWYMRPESEGSLLAGNGTVLEPHDPDQFNEAADTAFRDRISERLVRRVAGAEAATLRRGWAGLCVATPDRHPVCGPVPDTDGLYVLSGDNGYGIMRCLGLGERLAKAVDGDVHDITDPRRFASFEGPWKMQEGFGW